MMKIKKSPLFHPFLYTDCKDVYDKRKVPILGLNKIKINRHHLYPKNRTDLQDINKEKYLLRLWEHKHFQGWNNLFQFCFTQDGVKKGCELTIDEIITLMVLKHPFIVEKVGTAPWQILFKDKTLGQALDLLCRMLSVKFNYQWRSIINEKVDFVVRKQAA